LNRGWFVKPVFGSVTNDATISKILVVCRSCRMTDSVDHAVQMANDVYGLAAYVSGRSRMRARWRGLNASRNGEPELPAGHLGPVWRLQRSGNGREYADWGIGFCEVKGIVGYGE
jgi:acyl-CoA reductase-like NAD-dependent aldehyde dehydrogenase